MTRNFVCAFSTHLSKVILIKAIIKQHTEQRSLKKAIKHTSEHRTWYL